MLTKVVIIAILLGIIASLGAALVYMMKDRGGSERSARALTIRIGVSIGLFMLLFVLWWAGLIQPHGVAA